MKVMIVGAGKLGYKLAEAMNNEDIDVTLVDVNSKTLERINNHLDVLTIAANGIQIGVLKELDIETYDLLIAATDGDETNTLICSLAKRIGCKRTIARIRNPEFTDQLDFVKSEMGIDYIINPDLTTAIEIERYLLKNYNFHSGDFASGKVSMIDFNIRNTKDFVGKKIEELDGLDGLLITAISRDGNLIIPNGSTCLRENDVIYVIGRSYNIDKLGERVRINVNKKDIKRAMILGGGKIGYYLAKRLSASNVNVTIVEQDKKRCQYLSEKLDNALVIHGDGTDINLLEEEDLSAMDAFIGATGYDEENLLMTLVAKQSGVSKAIAKISRPSYINIIDKLDLDVAFNPVNITASNILKFIRGGKVVSVSFLLGGKGEVTEVIASEGLPIIGKPISELRLPKGIIIGAIVHNGNVIIPDGNSIIYPNDRIIVFSLESDIPTLKKLINPRKGGIFSELWGSH
ncbi:Trk system potassium transporter TrkA [Anaerosalibacter bizertensis]|uniref:Trk system potassium uptake protein TrkA n=1 Tax=Anaerosalibacter bizertensis TaxID=932217 RepID=A0A9Q4AAJ1_9FIRM|nr:Trk system potassium transporter TrkA [Anaerosalibacter bizertensis]MBV1817781.1 Trk system potassium transporter TrkA [Bacteroidales bacterium MSK.15.36]MCG4564298.1 Trk system potassium transporter TrkA [Anaerosalibacter bizertensis]MCG4581479.1 Trk system potassium transporter TrkA [Anaerosalibacter bizertensis]